MTIVFDILRYFFTAIDNLLYYLIEVLVSIFDFIANVTLFSDGVLEAFYNRVFYFIAIVMIFKFSFSIIQYIINPDTFSNGEKGFSKIIQGIILTLVSLTLVTPIFNFAKDIQRRVMDTNIIPSLILGVDGDSQNTEQENTVKEIPFYLAQAFVVPNPLFEDNLTDSLSNYGSQTQYSDFSEGVASSYELAKENRDYGLLFDLTHAHNDGVTTVEGSRRADEYIFEYRFLLSTACAIFVIIIYLNFCMDLAIRTVKLGFLQIISPIPIISMIDPKSAKGGMMSKWVKNCISTYLGLFIRIAAVSFVIFGIRVITNENLFGDTNGESNVFANIVIIFGLLMFARDLPKLISDLTGFDMNGSFNINPIRRFEEKAVAGRRITSTASGLVTGAVGGLATGGLAGLVGGGLRGAGTGLLGGQGIRQTRDAIVNRRHALENARMNGSTFGSRTAERLQRTFGIDTNLDRINSEQNDIARRDADVAERIAAIDEAQANDRRQIANNQKLMDIEKQMRDRAENRIKEGKAGDLSIRYNKNVERINRMQTQRDSIIDSANALSSQIEAAKLSGNTGLESALRADQQKLKDQAKQMSDKIAYFNNRNNDWMDAAVNNYIDSGADGAINGFISSYNSLAQSYGVDVATYGSTASARHTYTNQLSNNNTAIQNGFYNDDREKERLENQRRQIAEEKRALEERRRVAQANADAINRVNNGNNH